jgi:DNA topoisomerase-1
LRATCSRLADPGWLAVAGDFSAPEGSGAKEGREDDDAPPRAVPAAPERGADPDETGCRAASLPRLERGQPLRLVPPGVESEQKFTQPPARFSEGTLVREMEELGIGRPSTYAATVSTLLQRRYVRKTENRLPPTELGEIVIDRLLLHFPTIMDAGFTARMEEDLDRVESDQADWRKILAAFYVPFHADVDRAMREMKDVRREQQKTDETCEKCGAPLVKRWGRAGWFLACTAYPKCDFTKDVPGSDPATAAPPLPEVHGETCHLCGKPMRARRGRFGPFLACTGYPKCKGTRPLPTGVVCPKPGCGGRIVERRSRAGRNFWECENRKRIPRGKSAPKADAPPAPAEDRGCDFVLWKKPIPSPCPRCGSKYLVEMKSKGTVLAACPDETCGWRGPVPGADASAAGEQRPEE